jgi:pimeloyl-ACP methyl ester carboxylesterase
MKKPLVLEPTFDGNPDGDPILFVQGWPDDASIWDETVATLAPKYRCARVTMPNFGGHTDERWGYDTETIVEALVALIRRLSADRKVTLVLHDWGSYWGHAAHHRCPERVARVATLDVAPHYEPGPGAVLGIVAYQWWLLGAFVLGRPVGDWMTKSLAKAAHAPADPHRISAAMNYPYRNGWADLFTGRARELTKGYWPTCPLLFVYGERKPFPFHSDAWIDHVERVGGAVVGLPCGHWVMQHKAFVPVLTRWLEATGGKSPGGSA